MIHSSNDGEGEPNAALDELFLEPPKPGLTRDEVRALESYIKTVAQENSIVLVQMPEETLTDTVESLNHLNQIAIRFNIVFIACPMNAKLTVIPAHSEVTLEHGQEES